MADNTTLNTGTGGDVVATDDILGVKYQRVKITLGADGVNDGDVSSGNAMPVSATSLPLPSGAATAANQTTGNTSLGTIAGAVSGTEMQVDVLTMPTTTIQATDLDIRNLVFATDKVDASGTILGAGTNNIGDVDIASIAAGDNNIGNVDVLTLPATPTGDNTIGRIKITDGTDVADVLDLANSNPLTVAIVDTNGDQLASIGGGTQYTEDAPAAANPVGTAVNLIRQDTPAALTTTDGDNVAQRGTNYGAGYVQVVTSAGAYVDTFGGGTQYSDGDANADPTGTVAMGTDGANIYAVHTDTSGDLQVDVLTLPAITGTVTANAGTNLNTSALNLEATQADIKTSVQLIDDTVATDGSAAPTKGILIAGQDGTNAQTIKTDTDGNLQVDVLTMPSTTVTATDLDIRDLSSATDSVTVAQATGTNLHTVVDSGAITETNSAAILADTTNIETAVQLIDDTVATLGTTTYSEATTKGLIAGAVRRDADTSAVNTDNEVAPLLVNAIGALKVEVFSGETLPVSATDLDIRNLVFATDKVDASGTTLGANSGVDIGDVTINNSTGASAVNVQDGGNSLTVDAPIGTPVNVQVGNGTLAAGVIDETGASAVDALAVGGGTAHDAVDSGNPVKIGGVAVSGSASPTSVASGDRTRWIFNQHGIPYVLGGHPNLIVREFDFGTAAQTDVQLSASAVAADERCYIIGFEAMCDNANSVAVSVRAGFGTASVPTASATGVSGMIATHPGLAAGSGFVIGAGSGIIAVGAAGEEPRLTSSAATSGNLHVIIRYFIIDETP